MLIQGYLIINLGALEFGFSFTTFSNIFLSLLSVISISVYFYSNFYLQPSSQFGVFCYFYLVFVIVMSLLVYSSSPVSLLLFWDSLGISSFLLVLFYFTQTSVSGSLSTALSSRLGDFFLILLLVLTFQISTYLNFWCSLLFPLLAILVSFTKSAMYPFIGWLPMAMAAPTPVSSLVHSSTLVVSGLLILLDFSWLLPESTVSSCIILVASLSMGFSGILALVESDLKKVVAYSTLSQISFCMLALGLCLGTSCFFQALSHALFKSSLFMAIGYLIYLSQGQQDSRGMSFMTCASVSVSCTWSFSGLCGILFTSGATTKEGVLSLLLSSSTGVFLLLLLLISLYLTVSYCLNIWKGLLSIGTSPLSLEVTEPLFWFTFMPLVFSGVFIGLFLSTYLVLPAPCIELEFVIPGFLVTLSFLLTLGKCTFTSLFQSSFGTETYLLAGTRLIIYITPTESFYYKVLVDTFVLMTTLRSSMFLGVLSNHSLFIIGALALVLALV